MDKHALHGLKESFKKAGLKVKQADGEAQIGAALRRALGPSARDGNFSEEALGIPDFVTDLWYGSVASMLKKDQFERYDDIKTSETRVELIACKTAANGVNCGRGVHGAKLQWSVVTAAKSETLGRQEQFVTSHSATRNGAVCQRSVACSP